MPPESDLTPLLEFIGQSGAQGVIALALIWFGRRFLQQNDRLLMKLEEVISEAARAREAMDLARRSFHQVINLKGESL